MSLDAFVEELRLERVRAKIKQGQIAADLEIAQSTLSAWEARKARPPHRKLIAWALMLGKLVPDGVQGTAPCGTDSGYARHMREREPTCAACRAAHTASLRDYRSRRRS